MLEEHRRKLGEANPRLHENRCEGQFSRGRRRDEWAAVRAAKELKVNWGAPAGKVSRRTCIATCESAKTQGNSRTAGQGRCRGSSRERREENKKLVTNGLFKPTPPWVPDAPSPMFAPDGLTTVWSGRAEAARAAQGLAQMLGVANDRVRVIWVEAAGSYGRAGDEDVAADAALLSQAAGKPVRVQWSRADMTAWGGKGRR